MVVVGLLIGLVACFAPIAILILIISAFVKRNKDNKGNFEEGIRNIYVYFILIITLIAMISGVIATFRIGLDVALPEKTANQSSYSSEEKERNENIIELFTTISLVVAVTPVFIYHNKLAKKNRATKVEESKVEETNN